MNQERSPLYTGDQAPISETDYLIIGQGLCGTLLAWNLVKAGQKVIVVDAAQPFTASKVASGVINPVTGRRIVRTWRIEELLPFALDAYTELGKELGKDLVTTCNILDFHATGQMKEAFEQRLPEEQEYLHIPAGAEQWQALFNYHFGVGGIQPCLLVNLQTMLESWRSRLKQNRQLLEEDFTWNHCEVSENKVRYKNVGAKKIIFCRGVEDFTHPYFKNLPWSRMKGEALIISVPGLPRTNIYKQGLSLVPWKDDLFWAGSTYEWDFKDLLPTPAWKQKASEQLKYWLKIPFQVVDHLASERPANLERRPFVGLHPVHSSVGLFNGMGAKGCSLAPFFAKQLADHLVLGSPVYADADVRRFSNVLSR